ncbi:MAG TPA: DUF4386 domain-containing protein [Chthoniobacterales bacterium]|nr:DUF4386 domain-containing protein [Chthoniobacterales bacterium]
MNAIKKQAHIAGILYVSASITAVFSWIYVAGKIFVRDDATATANNIRSFETLLRFGIAGELIGSILFIFVVLTLYRLFRAVSEKHAMAMAILLLISTPISLLAVLGELAALIVAGGGTFLSAFDQHQLDSLSYLFFRLHGQALVISQVFWGLWLFPFGVLVIRSGFIPRFLGYLLWIAAFGQLANSAAALLSPGYRQAVGQFADPVQMAELPIIFWLLIWGAKDPGIAREAIPAGAS